MEVNIKIKDSKNKKKIDFMKLKKQKYDYFEVIKKNRMTFLFVNWFCDYVVYKLDTKFFYEESKIRINIFDLNNKNIILDDITEDKKNIYISNYENIKEDKLFLPLKPLIWQVRLFLTNEEWQEALKLFQNDFAKFYLAVENIKKNDKTLSN